MIRNRQVTAIVPIKGHSERVPGKNRRPFSGKPLFYHILGTLEETFVIDRVVVDTDSSEIAREAESLFSKVEIVHRPAELQGDLVSVNKLIAYDLSRVPSDITIQTHATNPLLRSKTISEAIKAYVSDEQCDSLFTVNRLQTRLYWADGRAVNHDPKELIRTQDLAPVYEENSALYIFTVESFSRNGRRIGDCPLMYETDRIESIDIDDEYTFRLAEMLAGYAHARS